MNCSLSGLTHAVSTKLIAVEYEEGINLMFRFYQQAEVCYSYHYEIPRKALKDSILFKRG